jgi:DNA-directed RNA polymerase
MKLPRREKVPVRTFSVHEINGISYGKFVNIFSLREVNGVSYGHFRDGFLPHMLANALYGLIGENAPKAVAAMEFLKALAELGAEHNKSIRWVTPLGFPIVNSYYKPDTKRIDGRQLRRSFVIGDKDEVDRDGAIDAIAANFVHSADAALLQLVALAAEKERIPMVSVHDCFGTIAPPMRRD